MKYISYVYFAIGFVLVFLPPLNEIFNGHVGPLYKTLDGQTDFGALMPILIILFISAFITTILVYFLSKSFTSKNVKLTFLKPERILLIVAGALWGMFFSFPESFSLFGDYGLVMLGSLIFSALPLFVFKDKQRFKYLLFVDYTILIALAFLFGTNIMSIRSFLPEGMQVQDVTLPVFFSVIGLSFIGFTVDLFHKKSNRTFWSTPFIAAIAMIGLFLTIYIGLALMCSTVC